MQHITVNRCVEKCDGFFLHHCLLAKKINFYIPICRLSSLKYCGYLLWSPVYPVAKDNPLGYTQWSYHLTSKLNIVLMILSV